MTKIILAANTDWYLQNFRLSLAHFLRRKGYEVVFVSPAGSFSQDLIDADFRWIEWKINRQIGFPWQNLKSILDLVAIYRKENPDIIHHHTLKVVLFGSLASMLAKKSILVNSIAGRGQIYSSGKWNYKLLSKILDLFFWLISRISKINWIFENQADLEYFLNHRLIYKGNFHLIESVGVDLDKYSMTPEPKGIPKILFVGRFLWSKGVGDLVEAVRKLKRDGLQLELILIGEPDIGSSDSVDLDTLDSWQQEGLGFWPGWQKDTSIWYQRANLFVFPTKYGEGVPTVLLEAAASGRAIVTSDIPGCSTLVENGVNGVLIPADNPDALANAIASLLSDPDLRRAMGEAGRNIAESRFSNQTINLQTLEVYNKGRVKNEFRHNSV